MLLIWALSARIEGGVGIFALLRRSLDGDGPVPLGLDLLSFALFAFLSMSRLGVWIFDLTTQQLTQTLVPAHQRSSFAGIESSVVNIFELFGAGAAIAFPHTDQFKWLSLASGVSVALAWGMYAAWVRAQRGHLVHWEKLGTGLCVGEGRW